MTGVCQCEHAHHFEGRWEKVPGPRRGTRNHEYGEVFDESELMTVHTMSGDFNVCKSCSAECLKGHVK